MVNGFGKVWKFLKIQPRNSIIIIISKLKVFLTKKNSYFILNILGWRVKEEGKRINIEDIEMDRKRKSSAFYGGQIKHVRGTIMAWLSVGCREMKPKVSKCSHPTQWSKWCKWEFGKGRVPNRRNFRSVSESGYWVKKHATCLGSAWAT